MKVLCVTEDKKLFELIRKEAARLEWDVLAVSDLAGFSSSLETAEPDVILADTNDPRIFDWWRVKRPSGQPVIFVGNRPAELRAIFDRLERLKGQRHFPRFGLHIDSERQIARIGPKRLILTLTELRLLRELAGMNFDAVARNVLEDCVFSSGGRKRRSLDVHICGLRKKLKVVGLVIESVRGVGYRLNPCRNSP